MFITLLTAVHIMVCIFLVVIVLLQHGKGADVGATFGGASNTVFGARGAATVLSKVTVGAAVLFMVTSMTLAVLATKQTSGSIFSKETPPEQTAPAMGGAPSEETAQPDADAVAPEQAQDEVTTPQSAPQEEGTGSAAPETKE